MRAGRDRLSIVGRVHGAKQVQRRGVPQADPAVVRAGDQQLTVVGIVEPEHRGTKAAGSRCSSPVDTSMVAISLVSPATATVEPSGEATDAKQQSTSPSDRTSPLPTSITRQRLASRPRGVDHRRAPVPDRGGAAVRDDVEGLAARAQVLGVDNQGLLVGVARQQAVTFVDVCQ